MNSLLQIPHDRQRCQAGRPLPDWQMRGKCGNPIDKIRVRGQREKGKGQRGGCAWEREGCDEGKEDSFVDLRSGAGRLLSCVHPRRSPPAWTEGMGAESRGRPCRGSGPGRSGRPRAFRILVSSGSPPCTGPGSEPHRRGDRFERAAPLRHHVLSVEQDGS